jgi:excisionase family DNA binding protein
MENLLTPAQVAQRMGVTRETVYSQISRGTLQSYKFGRSRRISEQQINDCLNTKYERPILVLSPNA